MKIAIVLKNAESHRRLTFVIQLAFTPSSATSYALEKREAEPGR